MRSLSNNPIFREILIAVVFVTGYQWCLKIPLPYLQPEGLFPLLNQFGGTGLFSNARENFSVLSLGVMPYASSYMIVELCSLVVPFLKKQRNGDYKGRLRLRGYAFLLTLIIGLIQSKLILNGISGIVTPNGESALLVSNFYEEAVFVSVHVGAMFVLVFSAELVSKYSVGNGISLLILSGICTSLFQNIRRVASSMHSLDGNFFHIILVSAILFCFLLYVSGWLARISSAVTFKHRLNDSSVDYFQLNGCPSGKLSVGVASSIVMLPATFLIFSTESYAYKYMQPGSTGYTIAIVFTTFLLNFIFGWLFIHPKKRIRKMQSWGWELSESKDELFSGVKSRFLFLNFLWSSFVCVVILLPTLSVGFFDSPFFFTGSSIFVLVFLCFDVIARFAAYKKIGNERLIKVAELHDVYDAAMIKKHLEMTGLKFYMQGFYHRKLLYIFGPYIPINLMAAKNDVERISTIMGDYYNGSGLLRY